MPRFDLAENLNITVRQVDPDDPGSATLYSDVSAPVELRGGTNVGVSVNVTQFDMLGSGAFLDVYLLGSNELYNWITIGPVGSTKVLYSIAATGTYQAMQADVPTRYVRVLYHFNTTDDWSTNPPPVGAYVILDTSLRNGP